MRRWDDKGDDTLWLITPEELTKIPNGAILDCVNGKQYTVGVDDIDLDVRFGHLAYGIRNPFNHELKHIFLLFALTQ